MPKDEQPATALFSWSRYFSGEEIIDPTIEELDSIEDDELFTKIPHEERGEERCVVSHPDFGGRCKHPAVCEVWHLPFCRMHGADAGALAHAEMVDNARDILCDLTEALDKLFRSNPLVSGAADRAFSEVKGKYPAFDRTFRNIPSRYDIKHVDEGVKRYLKEGGPPREENPEDMWHERTQEILRLMRHALDRPWLELTEMLEPMRERAMAQAIISREYFELHKEEFWANHDRKYRK